MKIDVNNNCTKCNYSIELDITEDLKRNFQCHIEPPSVVAIATPQGIANMTMFPVVNNKMLCSKGEMKPYIIN